MIPVGGTLSELPVEDIERPSLTWYLDFNRGRITRMADGIDAIKQTIFQILQTDRFAHVIYSFNYGHELGRCIGKSPLFVRSEVERMLQEALEQDDRIQSIENVRADVQGDRITVAFFVATVYGTFEFTQEVSNPNV